MTVAQHDETVFFGCLCSCKTVFPDRRADVRVATTERPLFFFFLYINQSGGHSSFVLRRLSL